MSSHLARSVGRAAGPRAAACGLVLVASSTAACGRAPAERSEAQAGTQAAAGAAAVGQPPVAGTLRFPVFLARFGDTPDTLVPPVAGISARFAPDGAGSLASFFAEASGGLLDITADVDTAWRAAAFPMAAYASTPALLLRQVVRAQEPGFDWGAYDNDGPDDVPNSGDDDGIVDVVVIVHSELGKECGAVDRAARDGLQTSRQVLTASGSVLPTPSPSRSRSGPDTVIVINEFIVAAGQGGDDACTRGAALPMGPIAHELGHILGIPELYDRQSPPGPGIGRWGLMAMGGLQTPERPVHMTAWALTQLGWVSEVPIERDTLIDIGPVGRTRQVHSVAIPGTGEYLLLSNRQPLGYDSSLVVRSPWGGRLAPGLLVWHVDSLVMRTRGFDPSSCWKTRATLCGGEAGPLRNTVNSGPHRGLALEVPDGDLPAYAFPFNPYDSTVVNPAAAMRPGAATTFTYPGVLQLSVLEGAPGGEEGTLRVRVDLQAGSVPRLGDVQLPDGRVGEPYEGQVTALPAPGEDPPRWSVLQGGLPPGLTLSAAGAVAGTPRTAGIFPVVAAAAGSGEALRVHLTFTIAGGP